MRLLLDTHVVLWWLTDDPTLSDEIKALLDHEPDVYVSAATIWEVAIKQSIGQSRVVTKRSHLVRAWSYFYTRSAYLCLRHLRSLSERISINT